MYERSVSSGTNQSHPTTINSNSTPYPPNKRTGTSTPKRRGSYKNNIRNERPSARENVAGISHGAKFKSSNL